MSGAGSGAKKLSVISFERSGQRSEEAFSCSPFSFFGFSFFLPFSNREKQNSLPILVPSSFLPSEKTTGVRVANFFGGLPIKQHKDILRGAAPPHIVVGTPGRVKQLAKEGDLKLGSLRHFVIDECDKVREIRREDREGKMRERESWMTLTSLSPFLTFSLSLLFTPHTQKKQVLDNVEMRSDVQEVFKLTPHDKQVMMFSATLDKEVRPICKKFMTDVSFREGDGGGKTSSLSWSDGFCGDSGGGGTSIHCRHSLSQSRAMRDGGRRDSSEEEEEEEDGRDEKGTAPPRQAAALAVVAAAA